MHLNKKTISITRRMHWEYIFVGFLLPFKTAQNVLVY